MNILFTCIHNASCENCTPCEFPVKVEKVIMVFNYAGNVFQPLFIMHYQNKKTKSTQLVKSKGKAGSNEYGRFNNFVLNNS